METNDLKNEAPSEEERAKMDKIFLGLRASLGSVVRSASPLPNEYTVLLHSGDELHSGDDADTLFLYLCGTESCVGFIKPHSVSGQWWIMTDPGYACEFIRTPLFTAAEMMAAMCGIGYQYPAQSHLDQDMKEEIMIEKKTENTPTEIELKENREIADACMSAAPSVTPGYIAMNGPTPNLAAWGMSSPLAFQSQSVGWPQAAGASWQPPSQPSLGGYPQAAGASWQPPSQPSLGGYPQPAGASWQPPSQPKMPATDTGVEGRFFKTGGRLVFSFVKDNQTVTGLVVASSLQGLVCALPNQASGMQTHIYLIDSGRITNPNKPLQAVDHPQGIDQDDFVLALKNSFSEASILAMFDQETVKILTGESEPAYLPFVM